MWGKLGIIYKMCSIGQVLYGKDCIILRGSNAKLEHQGCRELLGREGVKLHLIVGDKAAWQKEIPDSASAKSPVAIRAFTPLWNGGGIQEHN
jgi:hypothetical protein